MLRSAITRDSPTELPDRKRLYDAAYVDWNNEIKSRLIDLHRHVIPPEDEKFVEGSIFEPAIGDVILPLLSEIDGCLTKAYDAYRKAMGDDPGFACPGQPQNTCTGLVSKDVPPETGASGQDTCNGHWWNFVKAREEQARTCFDALSKDAFIYFRKRTKHRKAVAEGKESNPPVRHVPVFMDVCGAALGEDFKPWTDFVQAYGDSKSLP